MIVDVFFVKSVHIFVFECLNNFVDLWPEDVKPIAENAAQLALEGQRPGFEAACVRADGKDVCWLVVLNAVVDELDRVNGFAAIWTDITPQRQAEQSPSLHRLTLQLE